MATDIVRLFIGIIASTLLGMVGCKYMGNEPSSPLETVSYVDINRYMGVWHEIARYTNSFQTPEEDEAKGPKFLTHFRVERIIPLIGDGETGITLR